MCYCYFHCHRVIVSMCHCRWKVIGEASGSKNTCTVFLLIALLWTNMFTSTVREIIASHSQLKFSFVCFQMRGLTFKLTWMHLARRAWMSWKTWDSFYDSTKLIIAKVKYHWYQVTRFFRCMLREGVNAPPPFFTNILLWMFENAILTHVWKTSPKFRNFYPHPPTVGRGDFQFCLKIIKPEWFSCVCYAS